MIHTTTAYGSTISLRETPKQESGLRIAPTAVDSADAASCGGIAACGQYIFTLKRAVLTDGPFVLRPSSNEFVSA